jgi:hypothetical protein
MATAVAADTARDTMGIIRGDRWGLTHMWNGPVSKVFAASFAVGRSGHMSGLLARSRTAGHNEIRDADRLITLPRSLARKRRSQATAAAGVGVA